MRTTRPPLCVQPLEDRTTPAAPTVGLTVDAPTVAESGGTATITASLSEPAAADVTVVLYPCLYIPEISPSILDPDQYTLSASRITIPAGGLTGSVTFASVDDDRDEPDQFVAFCVGEVTGAEPAVGDAAAATVTVADDDRPVAVADAYTATAGIPLPADAARWLLANDNAAGPTMTGGGETIVVIPEPPGEPVETEAPGGGSTVELVGDGPAHGTLTLNAGGSFEYTPEAGFLGTDAFEYRVRNRAGEVSDPAAVTITVAPPPEVTFSVAEVIGEAAGGTTAVTATLSRPSAVPLTFHIIPFLPPVGSPGATPFRDYMLFSSTIVIPAGELTGSVPLAVFDDAFDEADEPAIFFFGVDASVSPAGGVSRVTLTITDDDPPVAVDDAVTTPADTPTPGAGAFPIEGGPSANSVLANDNAAPDATAELVGPGPAHGTLTLTPGGDFVYTPAAGFAGTDSFQYRVRNAAGEASNAATVTVTVTPIDAESQSGPPSGSAPLTPAVAMPPAGDLDGDGTADAVFVLGSTVVVQLSGTKANTTLAPFEASFTGGVSVARADLDGDGRSELIVSAGGGGGGRVQVYSLVSGSLVKRADFFGIADLAFRGGATATAADLDGDGMEDLVVAAGVGGGPRVAVFAGRTHLSGAVGLAPPKLLNDFFAFGGDDAGRLRNGVTVAAADLNGDGRPDLVFGAGVGGAPRVYGVDGADLSAGKTTPLVDFFVGGDTASRDGTWLTTQDVDGDGKPDLVASGPRGERVYDGRRLADGVGREPPILPDAFTPVVVD